MRLRRKTEMYRATVLQNPKEVAKLEDVQRGLVGLEGGIIVRPELDPPGKEYVREVTLYTPDGARVYLGIDKLPSDIAQGRVFDWPRLPEDETVRLCLLPEQWVAALAEQGQVQVAVQIEYPE